MSVHCMKFFTIIVTLFYLIVFILHPKHSLSRPEMTNLITIVSYMATRVKLLLGLCPALRWEEDAKPWKKRFVPERDAGLIKVSSYW